MKESNFHSDDFEELIREKTEQYKMYPSENVWKSVHNALHTRRKWYMGSMAFLVTGILLFSGRELLFSGHTSRKLAASAASGDNLPADAARPVQTPDNNRNNFVRVRAASGSTAAGRHSTASGASASTMDDQDQPYNHLTITISHPVVSQPDLSDLLSHAVRLPGAAPTLIAVAGEMPEPAPKTPESDQAGMPDGWLARNGSGNAAGHHSADASRETAAVAGSRETGREMVTDDAAIRGVLESLSARGRQTERPGAAVRGTHQAQRGAVVANIRNSAGAAKATTEEAGEESDAARVNWLHDYAVYTLPPSPSRGRWFLQLNLAPTINFRSLSGGSMASSKQSTGPIGNLRSANGQNWVDQSPGLGVGFGGNLLYRATRNLTLKVGIQFDYSRYKMIAYTTPPQQQQQGSSYRTPLGNFLYMDSLFGAQPVSVNGGPMLPNPVQATLYNDYFQLSAPVGFELRILGNERLQFNIGATVQPSYLLNTNAYVVTADYTSYTKEPSAFRRWNLTGGVEAFLSYQTGPIRWQVGPEFHYQFFSTYNSGPYPISENLRGYGLKIGIAKPLP
ncbi:MAG TPA: hypothetical protein VGR89_06635 [Puia sp.]|nr:hypothetical protein [Puia sp.]